MANHLWINCLERGIKVKSTTTKLIGLLLGSILSLNIAQTYADELPKVSIKTNMGEIVVELHSEAAPKTVDNFIKYVKTGQYKGTIFHRVIDNFMIQGGGYDKNMKEKPTGKPVASEAALALEKDWRTT